MNNTKNNIVIVIAMEIIIMVAFGVITHFKLDRFWKIFLFIFLLILPILLVMIVGLIKKVKILKELELKTDNLSMIKRDFQKGKFNREFIKPLKNLIKPIYGKVEADQVTLVIGSMDALVVIFTASIVIVAIDKTIIRFEIPLDEEKPNPYINIKGFNQYGTSHLYQELLIFIQTLINREFYYSESYFGKKIVGCCFKEGDKVIYEFHDEPPLKTIERNIYIK